MHIQKIRIEGYKVFRHFEMPLNEHLNIIVGDNETGKSTLLEAINLVLSCQLDGRNIQYELNPYIFNCDMVQQYFAALRSGKSVPPPRILIEAYLAGDEDGDLAKLRGTHNSAREDCPGLSLEVVLNEDFSASFMEYTTAEKSLPIMPIEYFKTEWRSFAGSSVATRNLPFRARMVDTSLARGYLSPSKYLSRIISDVLEEDQRVQLAIAYRNLKHSFMDQDGIRRINEHLATKKGDVTAKTLTVSMDMSARSTWDSCITAHLNDIPFDAAGKGEQSRVQMKLAIEGAAGANVLLVEEPENHLSHSRMCALLDEIARKSADRQLVLTTHSSFVLNKLGIDSVRLLSPNGDSMTLADLSQGTRDFFVKLPGHDTLRLLLSQKTILVEGPSDELIVQKAYKKRHGKLPIQNGVDVISVGTSFLRFLEIGALLKLVIRVVTDNDGKAEALRKKYKDYVNGQVEGIRICYDEDEARETLEPQLLKANSLDVLNEILGTSHRSEEGLLAYMHANKTECALRVFESSADLEYPEYIREAIE